MIPVSVLTGFLGSGKTTILSKILRDPRMHRTALIINEFGAVGLDHDLIETSDESIVTLTNGCLCCNVRSDLVLTLHDLSERRAAKSIPAFDRVVIETTGLADPAPILHALMTDTVLADTYILDNVITTVDAVLGLSTFDQHEEALRQAAVADRLILTKSDMPGADVDAIKKRLHMINPGTPVLTVVRGDISPYELLGNDSSKDSKKRLQVHNWPTNDSIGLSGKIGGWYRHQSSITSVSVIRDAPLHAATLLLFLSALAENCGTDLLRFKGIVGIAEDLEHPAVIHGVQHVYSAPEWLDRWPSDDRRTRMVFIGKKIRERWIRHLLSLIEREVMDVSERVMSLRQD